MYKISVILPTFNVEKYIKTSFDSLLSQTIGFENIQVIFVDDYSTDNSCKVIDKYASQYENVISIHLKENSGAAGKPRNEGIKFSFGEYLLFLDPDDYLMDETCEVLYNKIIESQADIVVAGYVKDDWIASWNSILNVDESYITNPSSTPSIFMNPPGLAAKLIRRDLVLKNNILFPVRISAQDLVFLTECYLNANSILSLNDFIAHRYIVRDEENDKSISNNVTKNYIYNLLTAYNLTLDLLEKFNVHNYLRKLYFSKHHISFFVKQLKRSDFNDSEIKDLFKSEIFLKFRNQNYILEDDNLNNFFERLIENRYTVDEKELTSIWIKAKNDYVNSDEQIYEMEYHPKNNVVYDENQFNENFNQELNEFLKETARLKNNIVDYKKNKDG